MTSGIVGRLEAIRIGDGFNLLLQPGELIRQHAQRVGNILQLIDEAS